MMAQQPCPGHADGRRPTPTFTWTQTKQGPVCADCGIVWPGHPLPTPIHHRDGYGELAGQPSWSSRVDAMVGELHELEEANA